MKTVSKKQVIYSQNVITITDQLKEQLKLELLQNKYSPYENIEEFLKASLDTFRKFLPTNVYQEIIALKKDLDSLGYLIIRNLPSDSDLCGTPKNVQEIHTNKNTFISEGCITGISQLFGEIYGYKNEKDGRLIHNIIPKEGKETALSNEGFGKILELHNEDIHLYPYSPTYLALYCLRKDREENAKTYVLSINKINEILPDDLKKMLSEELYYIESPESFGEGSRSSGLLPVLKGSETAPQIIAEFNDMRGITRESRKALEEFKKICYNSEFLNEISLSLGDYIIMDNRKVLHGRSCFTPYFDGEDRWCQRVFVKAGDLWDWRELFQKPRVLNL
ncbi:TauD/TfdA family dioxygenase [Kordia jejudonensis]|uniref:TauD/TfdA family dioxygenase n=1 Tax=Kordia jejudonensis TaxID=1348245 RepID=UPI000629504C|nr:TauD/TfdA family dioxygenase [Kordia jejudonensis]